MKIDQKNSVKLKKILIIFFFLNYEFNFVEAAQENGPAPDGLANITSLIESKVKK